MIPWKTISFWYVSFDLCSNVPITRYNVYLSNVNWKLNRYFFCIGTPLGCGNNVVKMHFNLDLRVQLHLVNRACNEKAPKREFNCLLWEFYCYFVIYFYFWVKYFPWNGTWIEIEFISMSGQSRVASLLFFEFRLVYIQSVLFKSIQISWYDTLFFVLWRIPYYEHKFQTFQKLQFAH